MTIDDEKTLTKVFSARRFEGNAKVSLDPSASFVMPAPGGKGS